MIRNSFKLLATLVLSAAALGAQADTYPSRPIKVISPFPAGGATDVLTRVLAERMAKNLGQSMIVENKAGAGTSIGAAYVSREAPDGYTILMATNSTLVTNRYLYKELPYDPDSFAKIGMVGVGPLVLLSSPKRPFNSTQDVVAYAKQNPGKLTFATFGPGTSSHLAGELFKERAGIDILHVPFKGATQALPALISGDVDLFFDMVATGMPQADAGKVKVFAITSPTRLATEPNVSTLAEQGYPAFDMTAWFSFVAPKGTPAPIVNKLNAAIQQVLHQPEIKKRLEDSGNSLRFETPEQFRKTVHENRLKSAEIVKAAKITIQ